MHVGARCADPGWGLAQAAGLGGGCSAPEPGSPHPRPSKTHLAPRFVLAKPVLGLEGPRLPSVLAQEGLVPVRKVLVVMLVPYGHQKQRCWSPPSLDRRRSSDGARGC